MITIYKKSEQEKIKIAGKIAGKVLDEVLKIVKVGVTTLQIDAFCHDKIIEFGGTPSCLGFHGYPNSICTCVNDCICHGIPNHKPLENGDIVNIDIVVEKDGYHGDTCRMYPVGKISDQAKKLIYTTYNAMQNGIKQVKTNGTFLEIAKNIQKEAEKNGFSVVREFCGHGIGKNIHEAPYVLNYVPDIESEKGRGIESSKIKEGMCFTIEPMINVGHWKAIINKSDGWTAVTQDGSLSAMFEQTIIVTKDSKEIATDTEMYQNWLQIIL